VHTPNTYKSKITKSRTSQRRKQQERDAEQLRKEQEAQARREDRDLRAWQQDEERREREHRRQEELTQKEAEREQKERQKLADEEAERLAELLPIVSSLNIPEATRFAGTWIIAPQGMGKTNLLCHLFDQDVRKHASIIVLDSKGDLSTLLNLSVQSLTA